MLIRYKGKTFVYISLFRQVGSHKTNTHNTLTDREIQ